MSGDLTFYQFSRSKVERVDFSNFLSFYAPEKLPEGPRLGRNDEPPCVRCERLGHRPREIHMIPEVRRFYSALHDAWPYWLYLGNFDLDRALDQRGDYGG